MADDAAAKTVTVEGADGGVAAPGTAAAGFDVAKGGWYTELSTMWPGMGMSLQVEDIIFKGRSDFQVRMIGRKGGRGRGSRRENRSSSSTPRPAAR